MNRVDKKFEHLRAEGAKAFIPFITAGDPSAEATVAIVHEVARCGASIIELGVPYSDPIADGPVIQASYSRALAHGTTPGDVFRMVEEIRASGVDLPVCLMVSYSLVWRCGVEGFAERASGAGVDGLIIPDLPVDEAEDVGPVLAGQGLSQVLLVAPTTTRERRKMIVSHATGFVYCVSITGITGERDKLPPELADYLADIKGLTDKPVCVGFGISKPEQVAMLRDQADGVIVGSAIVRRIAALAGEGAEKIASDIGGFVSELSGPLRSSRT
ncbi:MAG: tryptophan synthase subunit alpha [Planctomycetia bacterium]|nr:tryptophan synthase subunit alpha [Planctomycetia bacterium]